MAALENGKFGLAFSSGMGATDAVMKTLRPGDEVITGNDLYGGSYRIFTKVFANYGIKFHFIDLTNPANINQYLNQNTKMIWLETPTNPMMQVIDIESVAKISKANHLTLVVDNTFASPYLQNPLDLGADVVMHSVTKYIAGHSDDRARPGPVLRRPGPQQEHVVGADAGHGHLLVDCGAVVCVRLQPGFHRRQCLHRWF